MPEDTRVEHLERQVATLIRTMEKLQGNVAQLRSESVQPGLLFPHRREFQALESRVSHLEKPDV